MNQTTQLASGLINGHDRLTVELLEPPDLPPAILLRWPQAPTVCTPANYDQVAAAAMRVLGYSTHGDRRTESKKDAVSRDKQDWPVWVALFIAVEVAVLILMAVR